LLQDRCGGAIDGEAQFYLDNAVDYNDAHKIVSVEGVDLERLWGGGGFVSKRGSKMQVLGSQKRGTVGEIETIVDAMHCACELWLQGKSDEIT